MAKTNALAKIAIPEGSKLEDNAQWTNRFEIHSETSGRVYTIAQNKQNRHWGCSCPAWRVRRSCKHLNHVGLPCHEVPFEARLTEGK